MKINVKQFEELNLYSNKNVEKIVRNLVNGSSNAVLINMYEDCVILFDHYEKEFYMADYKFNPDNLTVMFEDYKKIDLVTDEKKLSESIKSYFDTDGISVSTLIEDYKENDIHARKYINEMIVDALVEKDFSEKVDFNEIALIGGINESITKKNYFKVYKERLSTNPLTEIKYFNWKSPVIVSLSESETINNINDNAVIDARQLWKNVEFKQKFIEASEVFVENVEEGNKEYVSLFENYKQLYHLEFSELKSILGKCLISSKLKDDMKDITEGIKILFSKYQLGEYKQSYLNENSNAPKVLSEEMQRLNITKEEKAELIENLVYVENNVKDTNLKEYIDYVIGSLAMDDGVKPKIIKEAVSLLSIAIG